jgi:purine-binding chemotaxis protein CheW
MTVKLEESYEEILVFELGNQRYGLPVADVIKTVRAVAITPLPQAPPIVEGILNFRGTVVPVLDIRARFHQRPKEMAIQDHFILARTGGRQVALRVDRATDLVRVPEKDIQEAKKAVPGLEYITGVARLSDGLVLIHDLGTFLSEAEARGLSESLSAYGMG